MKVQNNTNIYFGQKVPTKPLLRIGAGIFNYEDAKALCMSFDPRFPGHTGYYKKAVDFAQNIARKNPEIEEIFNDLGKIGNEKQKIFKILCLSEKLGKEIDLKV